MKEWNKPFMKVAVLDEADLITTSDTQNSIDVNNYQEANPDYIFGNKNNNNNK